jgi:hypothetical protein
MSKTEISIAKTRQIADEIAWRHFWLAHVMTETGECRPGKIAQSLRTGPAIRRPRQLRRLKPNIDAGSSFGPSDGRN